MPLLQSKTIFMQYGSYLINSSAYVWDMCFKWWETPPDTNGQKYTMVGTLRRTN